MTIYFGDRGNFCLTKQISNFYPWGWGKGTTPPPPTENWTNPYCVIPQFEGLGRTINNRPSKLFYDPYQEDGVIKYIVIRMLF